MSATDRESSPQRIFIFDNPRNRSLLFFQLLSTHPDLDIHDHPYVNASCLGPDKLQYKICDQRRSKLVKEHWEPMCKDSFTFSNSERELVERITEIENRAKKPLCNEHCCYVLQQELMIDYIKTRTIKSPGHYPSNPTVLPDDIWATLTPVFLIRHPALSITSLYRATSILPGLDNLEPDEPHHFWWATLKWARIIYDTLRRQGRAPIVVDGEDLCTRTDQVVRRLCEGLGLDPSGISTEWSQGALPPSSQHSIFTDMTRTIYESKGVTRYEPTGPIDVDECMKKFGEQYSLELAGKMKTVIEREMDDYRYLSQFKV